MTALSADEIEKFSSAIGDVMPSGEPPSSKAAYDELESCVKEARANRSSDGWATVIAGAKALFLGDEAMQPVRDLRVSNWLVEALCETEGVAGLSVGLKLETQLIKKLWDSIHPYYEPSNSKQNLRLASLEEFGPSNSGQQPSLYAAILDSKITPDGPKVSDLLSMDLSEQSPSFQQLVQIAVQDSASLAPSCALTQTVNKYVVVVQEKTKVLATKPNLTELQRIAKAVSGACNKALEIAKVPATVNSNSGSSRPALETKIELKSFTAAGGSLQIKDRGAAQEALKAVAQYLRATEPSHPAPLLIDRAISLIGKNFIEILSDLAPESVKSINTILGTK